MFFHYDKEKLLDLMQEFYTLTKLKIVVYDNQFKIIAAVPQNDCAFCAALRENKKLVLKCNESDRIGSQACRTENKMNIYKCHAGLLEAVAPIRIEDVIVGYVMLGQVLEEGCSEAEKEKIISYTSQFEIDDVFGKFKQLTVKSYPEVQAAAKIMESCVCYLLMHRVITEEDGNSAFSISRYISENLAGDLTVDTLCSRFQLSRNMLYKISETFFGMPIAQYVRKKRIEGAAEQIKNGVSVTKAAEITGFCDYTYFGKVFKSIMGITPNTLKRMHPVPNK